MMCKLSDICEFVKGKVAVSNLTKTNYISTENMLPNRGGIVEATTLPSVDTTQTYTKCDILVSNIRPYFKKIWLATTSGGCSNDVLVFRAKKDVNPFYLYYILSDDRFFNYATATSKGTKMPRGDKIAIMNYEIEKHSRSEQDVIASILRPIDEKIALNREINNNLEKQLSILYRQLFENESRDVELGSVVETTSGGTPSRKNPEFYEPFGICWVKSKELLSTYIIDTEEHINEMAINKSSAKLLPKHSVLIAMYGATVGAYGIISSQMTCNQAVCALLPNDKYPYTYLFQVAKESQQILINMAVGSAQQNISQILIKQLPIHSNTTVIEAFHTVAMSIHHKIEAMQHENRTLMNLRETLLPQLLLGELDVSTIEF